MSELNFRRIGGSDAAAVMGVSPYGTPLDVYLRIKENIQKPQTLKMANGKRFERTIASWWAEQSGRRVEWFEHSIEHPNREWQRFSPDVYVVGEPAIADIKRTSYARRRHGEPGTDEIADYEMVQLHTYAEALRSLNRECDRMYLVVHDLQSDDLLEYIVQRDDDLCAMIVESCERFWVDHIVPSRPPPPSTTAEAASYLAKQYPKHTLPLRPADAEEVVVATVLQHCLSELRMCEERVEELRNRMKEKLGECAGIEGEFGRIHWTTRRGREITDWKALAEHIFEGSIDELNTLAKQFTKTSDGSRVFRTSFKEIDDNSNRTARQLPKPAAALGEGARPYRTGIAEISDSGPVDSHLAVRGVP